MTKVYMWVDGTFYKTMEEAKDVVKQQHPDNPEVWFAFITEYNAECAECGEPMETEEEMFNGVCKSCAISFEYEMRDPREQNYFNGAEI